MGLCQAPISQLLAADPLLVTFDGGTFSGSNIGLNYTVKDLGAGADLSLFSALASGNPGFAYSANGWTTSPTYSPDSSMFFTITPAANYRLSLTSISFDYQPQGAGPQRIGTRVQVGSESIKDYVPINNDDISPATLPADAYKAWTSYLRPGSANSSAGQSITVFLVGFDAQNSSKGMSIDNITLRGTVTAIPEPSSIAQILVLLGASAVAFGWRGRHKKSVGN
jgi:hypothetical protein